MTLLGQVFLRYGGAACGIMTIVIAGLILAHLARELEMARGRKHERQRVWTEINWVVGYATAFLTASTVAIIVSF